MSSPQATTKILRLPGALSWTDLALMTTGLTAAALLAGTGEGAARWLGVLLLLASLVLAALLLRRAGGGKELDAAIEALRAANRPEGDLTYPLESGDAAGQLVTQLRQFIDRIRAVMEDLQQHSIRVSLAAAHSRKYAEEAKRNATQQEEFSELIFSSSNETASAIEELSKRTSGIADVNSRNLQTARSSLLELGEVAEQIGRVTAMLQDFHGTVARLEATSSNINEILDTVQSFAAQTNMLALNAAIEAARAGEQGRGFAVVADEVRELAGKVRGAADEIQELVAEMNEAVGGTASSAQGMIAEAEKARDAIQTSARQFEEMVQNFAATHDDLLRVSAAIEELSVTNREIHNRSTEIRDLGIRIREDMDRTDTQTAALRQTTEQALSKVSQFRIGSGRLEEILKIMYQRRDQLSQAIEKLLDQGVDMFDRNHVPIPGTNPQKYTVSYAEPFQRACQDLVESWRTGVDGAAFCLPRDSSGFVAIHYREFSQPMTGDPQVDLLRSRNMRFFGTGSPEDLRRYQSEAPFQLSTYMRDTGEIMLNLSVPVHVRGRHWGSIFIGLDPDKVLAAQ